MKRNMFSIEMFFSLRNYFQQNVISSEEIADFLFVFLLRFWTCHLRTFSHLSQNKQKNNINWANKIEISRRIK